MILVCRVFRLRTGSAASKKGAKSISFAFHHFPVLRCQTERGRAVKKAKTNYPLHNIVEGTTATRKINTKSTATLEVTVSNVI